jgi:hypothetical protein
MLTVADETPQGVMSLLKPVGRHDCKALAWPNPA